MKYHVIINYKLYLGLITYILVPGSPIMIIVPKNGEPLERKLLTSRQDKLRTVKGATAG